MTFTVIDAPQGSPEWLQARCGLLTGSRASAVLAKGRSSEAAERRNYRSQLVAERLTGVPADEGFVSDAMKRGAALEPEARAAYEAQTGVMLETTGFLRHLDYAMGCSLDGHIGAFDGIVEFKCPMTATHIGYLEADTVPSDYLPQIRHNLLVTGAAYADFVSYDPRLGDGLSLFIKRVYAVDLDLSGYKAEALKFLAEVDAKVAALTARRKVA